MPQGRQRDRQLGLRIPAGLRRDLEEIARHPYQQENYIPLFREGWERRQSNK